MKETAQSGFNNPFKINLKGHCPKVVTKKMAYFDHQIKQDGNDNSQERQGWMHCYCFNELKKKGPASLFDIDFTDVKATDKTKYCQQWSTSYIHAMSLKYGSPAIILLINMLVPMIFDQFSKFERQKTINEETMGTFIKITFL